MRNEKRVLRRGRGPPSLTRPSYTWGQGNAKGTSVAGRGTGEPDVEVGRRRLSVRKVKTKTKVKGSGRGRPLHMTAIGMTERETKCLVCWRELPESLSAMLGVRDPSTSQVGSLRAPTCFAQDDRTKSKSPPCRKNRDKGGAPRYEGGWEGHGELDVEVGRRGLFPLIGRVPRTYVPSASLRCSGLFSDVPPGLRRALFGRLCGLR